MVVGLSDCVVCYARVIYVYVFCVFFCFKQKTAYEMRISDWSSDVCSSDLYVELGFTGVEIASISKVMGLIATIAGVFVGGAMVVRYGILWALVVGGVQIGRASCRERVCQYV